MGTSGRSFLPPKGSRQSKHKQREWQSLLCYQKIVVGVIWRMICRAQSLGYLVDQVGSSYENSNLGSDGRGGGINGRIRETWCWIRYWGRVRKSWGEFLFLSCIQAPVVIPFLEVGNRGRLPGIGARSCVVLGVLGLRYLDTSKWRHFE